MINTKKKNKKKIKLLNILVLFSFIASIFLIYNILLLKSIETPIRIIIIVIILGIDLYFFRKNMKLKKKKKLFITLMITYIIINLILGLVINKVYSLIDNTNKNKITYSASLIALKDNGINNIDDVVNKKIGIINNIKSIDNYVIANEIIEDEKLDEDNEIVKYDDLTDMLRSLYKKEIDLMFISSDYSTMFSSIEEFENIKDEVVVITDSEKTVNKKDTEEYVATNGKDLTEAFTLLLIGVDSTSDTLNKSTAHGDSLILITFNPATLNATMLSIPRDSYVPIMCFKDEKESKLTHAAWYGTSCVIDTIENALDVNIDYYAKINFKGVVKLVNALGGVEVEVPKDLCTDSSDRNGEVCIKKGVQTLNGEEALVLARNRYDLARGDLDRGQNQQLLIKAMLNKLKDVKSASQFTSILETISNNIDTNLSTGQILSFYNVLKDILKVGRINTDIVNIEKLYLQGTGQMIYDEGSKMTLWNYILNNESIDAVKNEMNNNINNNVTLIKKFNYSIKDNYTSPVVGKDITTSTTKYTLLPSFIGKSKSRVEEFVKNNNINVKYIEKIDNDSIYENGYVIGQNYKANTRVDKIDTLEITILKKTINTKIDCSDINNTKNECYLPSFIGMTKEEVSAYFNRYENLDLPQFNEISQSLYPGKKIGTVVSQNYKVNTHLSKVKNLELSIITK